MDQERLQQLKHDPNDWLGFGTVDSREETDRFFSEACERFAKDASGPDTFEKVVRNQEQRFSQRFSHFLDLSEDLNVGGKVFDESKSEVGESRVENTEQLNDSKSSALSLTRLSQGGSCFTRFPSFGCFPRFNTFLMTSPAPATNKVTASWGGTEKIEYSRSTFYCTNINSYRFSSDQANGGHVESYDVSESESEDEETPIASSDPPVALKAIEACSPEPCQLSIAPSEISETSTEVDSQLSPKTDPTTPTPEQRRERTFRIANELLTTERSYVDVLILIDQVFHFRVDQENRAHHMFPQEMVPQMFSNIKSIYKFHHDFLLPQLEERMKNWEVNPRIGDIMANFAPFLKLYTEYVKNFDSAMSIINAQQAKNPRFAAIMNEIHEMPECGHLTLTHHMLSPIQRVPRYELLLKDYLKKLPEDSNDVDDTKKALHLVSTAANHANEAMKKISQFQQLLEIQENISGAVDLVSPTRELLKEGRVHKISARSGDHQERYLFLFSDVLLLCSPRLISNRVISGPTYRLRVKFDVESLQVLQGDNLETANTFYVRDHNKNVELYTQTNEEKVSWLDALYCAMTELFRRKSSLRISPENSTSKTADSNQNSGSSVQLAPDSDLGKRAPSRERMDTVQRCQNCSVNFGVMKRKHHCHACGRVVCSKCSDQKLPLPFEDNKMCRVCQACYKVLIQRSAPNSPEINGPNASTSAFSRGKGVLEVPAGSPCVLSGYMQLKTPKSWVSRWFALHSDFVLYSFRSHNEKKAMTATPVPGFTVAMVTENKGEPDGGKERMFKMYHTRKTYYFQTKTKDEAERWVRSLGMASQAELPSPDGVAR